MRDMQWSACASEEALDPQPSLSEKDKLLLVDQRVSSVADQVHEPKCSGQIDELTNEAILGSDAV